MKKEKKEQAEEKRRDEEEGGEKQEEEEKAMADIYPTESQVPRPISQQAPQKAVSFPTVSLPSVLVSLTAACPQLPTSGALPIDITVTCAHFSPSG